MFLQERFVLNTTKCVRGEMKGLKMNKGRNNKHFCKKKKKRFELYFELFVKDVAVAYI